jgi:murein DD-endopeptidase MepM/ murein hydrolase activator NlpD
MLTFASAGAAKHARPSREPDSVRVKPSEAIEIRVEEEVAKAKAILDHLDARNLFESPYLTSATYYHDGFLSNYPADRKELDPSARIIAHISHLLTRAQKREYVAQLSDMWWSLALEWSDQRPALPVIDAEAGRKRRRRQPHPNALDLFVPEGSPVHSATQGLVILAEGGWREGDPFSTSSLRGGNAVIVFCPNENRFYRYCHLEGVDVAAGATVEAGQQIGTVGHTGFNASRKGHGRHLHFEVNEFDGNSIRALDKHQLEALLRGIAEGGGPDHSIPAAFVSRTAKRGE